jgi:signal-transduction protein with cAMP-binding, CBS, and nucleotidyltransferase domain
MQALQAQEALEADHSVGSIMSSPVQSLMANTKALDALRLAEEQGIHHFPVFEDDELVGLVCTCDLEEVALTAPIKTAIRRSPVTLDLRCDCGDAVQKMRKELVGSVLVMREGDAVGILTREDLSRAGIDVEDAPNFHCDSCGAVTHLKREGKKGILCLDCRSRSNPEHPDDGTDIDDETGVGD